MTLAPAIKLHPTNQTLAWSASDTITLHPERNPRHQLESCSTEVPRVSSERPGAANGADAGRTHWSVQIRKRSVEAASRRPRPTTSGRCSNRASVLRPTSLEAHPSRCSLDLSPSEAIQHCRWAEALPSCAYPTHQPRPESHNQPRQAALQGVNPTTPGHHSEDWHLPPWDLTPLPITRTPKKLASMPARFVQEIIDASDDSLQQVPSCHSL